MIYLIILIPLLLYACIWTYFILGCMKKPISSYEEIGNDLRLSIVIPFRNERDRIGPLLSCLDQLNTSGFELNIFFIDDHSEDGGKEFLNLWKKETNKCVQIIELEKSIEFGKKRAIKRGVDQSNDDWIFILDADSTISIDFLQEFKKEIIYNKDVYLLPVVEESSGFLLSVVESYMLSIISFASANNNQPILSNGTGMIIKRSLFLQLDPYEGNYHIASGDDLFLLEKIKKEVPYRLHPLRKKKLIVHTASPKTYSKMLNRSIRWAGKMNRSNLHFTKVVGLIVILCNYSILLTFVFQLYENTFKVITGIIALKFFFDLILFLIAVNFYGSRKLIIKTPIVFLLYPLHLLFVMINLMIRRKVWKGRKI